MAENSSIEWTDHTFNPWVGCTKVSAGCKYCYAEALMDHRFQKVKWGEKGKRERTSPSNWNKPLMWNRKAECEGRRYKVFCSSLADVFDTKAPQQWRDDLWELVEDTPNLDWQLLTKRPENVLEMVPISWRVIWPEHVWIGTSVESQDVGASRISHLSMIPAPVRFLSCEPLLGRLDLGAALELGCVNWVIAGGESGQSARPMQAEWARYLRDQCREAKTPFFFKQWGEHNEHGIRLGKKKTGNILDGAIWAQFPKGGRK